MSAAVRDSTMIALSLEQVQQFLYREARALDDRDWDELARLLRAGCRVLDAGLGRRRRTHDDPQTRGLAHLLPDKEGLRTACFASARSARARPVCRIPRTSHNISNVEILEQGGGECRLRFNWISFNFRYNIDRHVLRNLVLYARHLRGEAADQEQKGDPEERLYPPRRRHLPHLRARRHDSDEPQDRAQFRGRRHALHRLCADRDGRRRVVPAGINIPLDCRDGACGTCKCVRASRASTTAASYIEDALTDEEAEEGYVLACQMRPKSDCVLRIAASSDVCKTKGAASRPQLSAVDRLSDTAIAFSLKVDPAAKLSFLPGQYANLAVPGTDQKRSYSFSSPPGSHEVSFLVRTSRPADEHLSAGTGRAGHPAGVHRPVRDLLSARHQSPGVVPGGRHRPGTLPVDARQSREGG